MRLEKVSLADKALASPQIALPQDLGKVSVKLDDLVVLGELGAGNGGTVDQCLHVPSDCIMARKVIHVDAKNSVRKQILRELQIMHKCSSDYIVSFFGAFLNEGDIHICMEYMDCGSLDTIYKKTGPIHEDVVGKITLAVLKGLVYLKENHGIIHRDVKPSNILLNREGEIKIADFGVSGQLINSVANTFVGTSAYMSPERIQGGKYSVQSDVWSLGITMMEIALGKFPFPPEGKPLTVFELLEYIVNEPVIHFSFNQFTPAFIAFMEQSLIKDPAKRPTPSELLDHEYVVRSERQVLDMKAWVAEHLPQTTTSTKKAATAATLAALVSNAAASPDANGANESAAPERGASGTAAPTANNAPASSASSAAAQGSPEPSKAPKEPLHATPGMHSMGLTPPRRPDVGPGADTNEGPKPTTKNF